MRCGRTSEGVDGDGNDSLDSCNRSCGIRGGERSCSVDDGRNGGMSVGSCLSLGSSSTRKSVSVRNRDVAVRLGEGSGSSGANGRSGSIMVNWGELALYVSLYLNPRG